MNIIRAMQVALAFVLVLTGCSGERERPRTEVDQWIEADGKLRVLCTIAMISDLVREIGGEEIACLTLIKGQLDPHTYELVKGDDEKLAYAEQIFYNGLTLEHGPSLRHALENNPKAVAVGDAVMAREPEQMILVDGQPDPHIWTDISLWAKTIDPIVDALSQRLPEHADAFSSRGNRLRERMLAEHKSLEARMQCIDARKRYLVTSHDAFNYFARAYLSEENERGTKAWEKRCEAPEGLAPDSQLSALDIQRLIDHMKTYGITVLFPESNVSQDSIRKIMDAGREKGLDLLVADTKLYADAMGAEGSDGDTYLKMMRQNGRSIAQYLDMQCLNVGVAIDE